MSARTDLRSLSPDPARRSRPHDRRGPSPPGVAGFAEGIVPLRTYPIRNGGAAVLNDYRNENGFKLGKSVQIKRNYCKDGRLPLLQGNHRSD